MRRFQIGFLAVAALVLLRLGLGCHFLYEGVWKIKNADEFSSEPFLTQAKGPLAGLFYAMVPDIDARGRLRLDAGEAGESAILDEIAARWKGIGDDFLELYRPAEGSEEQAAAHNALQGRVETTLTQFRTRLKKYLDLNAEKIGAYFDALDRFENDKERTHAAPFQKERRWNRMMLLRQEAAVWTANIEAQEEALKNDLARLLKEDAFKALDDENKRLAGSPSSWNPLTWSQMELIDFAVTYGLTAIGICLMLGFCTPLAALGGAGFMCFVVMTQPAFPGIYPPDPAIVGHALLVNKDFVEMLALLVVACASAGRWGGLDFFLYRWYEARRRRKELKRLSEKYPQGENN